jgi:hypothetical protein
MDSAAIGSYGWAYAATLTEHLLGMPQARSPEESNPDEYGFFAHENCLLSGKPPKSDQGLKNQSP